MAVGGFGFACRNFVHVHVQKQRAFAGPARADAGLFQNLARGGETGIELARPANQNLRGASPSSNPAATVT